jgi:hypothetical protein
MPNPKNYESEDDWMGACVPRMIDEGKKQDQAVAACMNMWRNKEVDEAVSFWQQFKELFTKEKPMKTVDGVKYPASDFLVVEDPQSPNTWHLQVKKHGTPDHNLMGAAKAALTSSGGHRGNPYQGPNKQEAIAKLKRLYASEKMEWTKEISSFLVWKEAETYRWLAVYSNKWRDQDNPPEILASTAHKDFVDAVDKGDWPYPEAWLWHVPGTKFGVADYVAYDESGFALASGTVDKGQEHIAEFLMAQDDLAMSHGMPVKEIERDTEDPTIITRYRTMEVSPLPRESAANRYGTAIEFREVKMAIPENKRPFLTGALGEKGLEDLEAKLADKAKELEELEIESKEEAPEEVECAEESGCEESEEEAKEESAPEPQYVTVDEMIQIFDGYVKPLVEQIASLNHTVAEQDKELKALRQSDEEKMKETLANTPAASLFERIGSVIGAPETYVDGRTSLAKDGPSETRDGRDGPAKVGIINELLAQTWGQR